MHSQQPPGVVQNWSTLHCSKQNTEQCGYDHAPVTRGRMRAQFPLPHGPGWGGTLWGPLGLSSHLCERLGLLYCMSQLGTWVGGWVGGCQTPPPPGGGGGTFVGLWVCQNSGWVGP